MAAAGMKPVAAIYSTFMQRAYDSIMHDICMQKLHVTLCLDRAGLVGDDGYTHHGVFDYAYLRSIPNMTIMAPKDENELQHMLKTALDFDGPVSVRYPRGSGVGVALDTQWQDLPIGKAEVLRTGNDVCFWAIGSMVQTALDAAELLEAQGISAGVVICVLPNRWMLNSCVSMRKATARLLLWKKAYWQAVSAAQFLKSLMKINCWSNVKYVASAFLTNLLCMATKNCCSVIWDWIR